MNSNNKNFLFVIRTHISISNSKDVFRDKNSKFEFQTQQWIEFQTTFSMRKLHSIQTKTSVPLHEKHSLINTTHSKKLTRLNQQQNYVQFIQKQFVLVLKFSYRKNWYLIELDHCLLEHNIILNQSGSLTYFWSCWLISLENEHGNRTYFRKWKVIPSVRMNQSFSRF